MSTEEQRDPMTEEIALTVMQCVFVWESDGVPAEQIEEMSEELTEHLLAAARDGQPVEAVVGGDVGTFANEWGAPHRPPDRWRRQVTQTATCAIAGMPLMLLVQHLRYRSLNFPLDARKTGKHILRAIWVAAFAEMTVRARLREEKPGTTLESPAWKEPAISIGASTLPYAALLGINVLVKGSDRSALFEWSWKSTLLATAASAVFAAQLWKKRRRSPGLQLGDLERKVERRLQSYAEPGEGA